MTASMTWFITGVSSGIGRAIAQAALARGDSVYGTLRNSAQLDAFEQLAPGRAHALHLDVREPEQIARVSQQACVEGIDVLVNNAGIGMVGALEECSLDEARSVFETNFFGALQVIRVFLPHMRSRRSGRIINMSSGVGLMGLPGMPIYSASKHALEGLSEALAQEVAPLGIKVTLVEPGAVLSNFTGPSMLEARQRLDDYAPVSGFGRAGLAHYYATQAANVDAVARAVVEIADDPAPPLRRLVGADVLQAARAKYEQIGSLIEAAKP